MRILYYYWDEFSGEGCMDAMRLNDDFSLILCGDEARIREELSGTEEYEKLHRQLILAFYDRVGEQIDAGVAL